MAKKIPNKVADVVESVTIPEQRKSSQCDDYFVRLVKFHSAFGISYNGVGRYCESNFVNQIHAWLMLLYDLFTICLVFVVTYAGFSRDVYENMFRQSERVITMNIIFYLSGYCFMFEFLAIRVGILLKGRKIIAAIRKIGNNVCLNKTSIYHYKIIYLVMIGGTMIDAVAILIDFYPTDSRKQSVEIQALYVAIYTFASVGYGISKGLLLSLHMYTSIVMCQRIKELKDSLSSNTNYCIVLDQILTWKKYLSELNNQLSIMVLVKFACNGVLQASIICVVEEKFHESPLDYLTLLSMVFFFITQSVELVASCYASQRIINHMADLVTGIQEMSVRQALTSSVGTSVEGEEKPAPALRISDESEHRIIQHICSMRGALCFSVYNVFDLRSVTSLIIISNVCNYAVILIQTK